MAPFPLRPLLSEKDARQKLLKWGQLHLFAQWEHLSEIERNHLLFQISQWDEGLFQLQRDDLFREEIKSQPFYPFTDFSFAGDPFHQSLGRKAIREGKCACLVVAGGQGSRLRFLGPKGCFPISQVKRKSLFQLFAEKVKAAGHQAGVPLECAVMTSPHNHVETELFFEQHAFFGLSPSQLHFFPQKIWPLLDFKGNLFLETPSSIAFGPNGNGGALHRLREVGLLQKWKEKGIQMVNFVQIDNPLADPFDAELFGFHIASHNEITLKACLRKDPQENVGMLVKKEGKTAIVEYSEAPQKEKEALKEDHSLLHPLANLSLFCFSLDFIEKIGNQTLPFHRAKKTVKSLDASGHSILPEEPNAWKFEEFIFDVLPFAQAIKALVYPREECFAPLKNFKGADSMEAVQAALQAADRKAYFRVSGIEPTSSVVFELSQGFYYPTEAIMQKWKGKPLPAQPYIEA